MAGRSRLLERRVFLNTSDSLGFYKGSLPVCITDNEIYRYLPSVLVGTVDKLAIIARSAHFVQIVRGAQQQCAEHGYTSYDQCIESGDWTAKCSSKRGTLNSAFARRRSRTFIADPGRVASLAG